VCRFPVMGNRYGAGNPAYDGLNRLTRFNGAAIQHDLLGNRLQDGRYLYQWDALNRLVQMQAYQASGRFKVVGDAWRFVYRADGLRVVREKVSAGGGGRWWGRSRRFVSHGVSVRWADAGVRAGVCGVYFADDAGKLLRCARDRGGGDGRPFSSMLPPISYREKLS
jgi:hypothetical protein